MTLIHVCARFTSSRVSLSLTLFHVEQLRMSYDEICRRKLFSTNNGIYQFRQFYHDRVFLICFLYNCLECGHEKQDRKEEPSKQPIEISVSSHQSLLRILENL